MNEIPMANARLARDGKRPASPGLSPREISADFTRFGKALAALKPTPDLRRRYDRIRADLKNGADFEGFHCQPKYGPMAAKLSLCGPGQFYIHRDGLVLVCESTGPEEAPWSVVRLLDLRISNDESLDVPGVFPNGEGEPRAWRKRAPSAYAMSVAWRTQGLAIVGPFRIRWASLLRRRFQTLQDLTVRR
jgi:hypothetical protein